MQKQQRLVCADCYWFWRLAPIYRFYNPTSGAHFYTISAAERDFLVQNNRSFAYEGPVYYTWTTAQ